MRKSSSSLVRCAAIALSESTTTPTATETRPARNGAREPTPALVTELMPLGSFATWQAERAIGDHDRSTLRLRPGVDTSKTATVLFDPKGERAHA